MRVEENANVKRIRYKLRERIRKRSGRWKASEKGTKEKDDFDS